MAAPWGSPGSSSASSFDPYVVEDVTDSKSQTHAGTPGQVNNSDAAVSNSHFTGQHPLPRRVARSHRLENLTQASIATSAAIAALPNPLPAPVAVAGPSNSASTAASTTGNAQSRRKRKRGAGGKHPGGPKGANSKYSSEYDGHVIGVKPQSDSPSSSADGTKRVKFRDDVNPDNTLPSVDTTPADKSKLPREIWQHIFTFLPPVSLGRVLQVNRTFKALLTVGQSELPPSRATHGSLKYVSPGHIWSTSRKCFHAGMPRPLTPLSDLDMWKLVRGTSCQFCNKPGSHPAPDALPFEGGPGENGVRIIWPLAVRTCGACLKLNCETEMDLLFSTILPSVLVPALPFAFLTPSLHYVTSVTLRGQQPPAGLVLTKHFLKAHIEELKVRFEEAKALGPAAAEEWMKGLEGNGKEKIADAARWEQSELAGGLRSLRSPHPAQSNGAKPQSLSLNDGNSIRLPVGSHRPSSLRSSPPANNNSADTIHPRPRSTGAQLGFPLPSNAQLPRDRNLRQINEAKASRRSEIERRCAELDPPLAPEVINHMESFTAAIQITHPFTDRDWEILKPRLLAQREVAERRESDRKKHDAMLQAKSDERRHHEAQIKEQKELHDREWDDVQKPIKERMAGYADEIIREGWRGGEGVTKEKCSKFAADVIMYVRKRFLEDLAQEDARNRAEGKPIEEDSPNGPPRRKIILENMKFIFDTKIKLLTEQFQKELFLCNGCDNNAKYYGFEGVIQHYAAKHTNILSLGSVVVHWRAEWPERPPFNPDPASAKLLMYAMPRPHGGQSHIGYSNPQPSPGPYNRTPYGTPYAYGTGPYRPPSPQYYPPPPNAYGFSPQPPFPSGPFEHPHAPPGPTYSPYPTQAYPPPYAPGDPVRHPVPAYQPPYSGPSHVGPHYNPVYPPSGHHGRPPAGAHKPNQGSQSFSLYQTHLDEIAKNARSVWNGTSGIKDLPHNVRAHVVIHHVTTRFIEKFGQEPALTLFAEGLNTHAQMKPIRNLSGLVCKACTDMSNSRRSRQHDIPRNDRKMYHLPALFSHFQSVHVDSSALNDGIQPDWKVHMLLLPDNTVISSLGQAPGMDQAKFQLITSAFPWVFSPITAPIAPAPIKAISKPIIHGAIEGKPSEHVKFSAGGHGGKKLVSHQVPEMAMQDFYVESAEDVKYESARVGDYNPHRPAFNEPVVTDTYSRGARANVGPTASPREKYHGKPHPEMIPGEESAIVESRRPRPQRAKAVGKDRPGKAAAADRTGSAGGNGPSRHDATRPVSGNVSEDGEVAESNEPKAEETQYPTEEMNAAEHFLNSFVPGQDQAEVGTTSRGSNPQLHSEPRGKWAKSTTAEEREWRVTGNPKAAESSHGAATSGRSGKQNGWSGRGKSPVAGREYRDFDSRADGFDMQSGPPSVRGDVLTPDQTEGRGRGRLAAATANAAVAAADAKVVPEARDGRSHNRFDRYEAQRQESLRPRSRSPMPQERAPVEYYRNRSPRARPRAALAASQHQPEAYVERIPIDHPAYARAPPQGQYRYVEEYIDPSYDGAVEYVPVRVAAREPQNGGQYYIERPVHRGMPPEYVSYDMEYARQPVMEQPQHYYSAPGARDIPDAPPPAGARRARYR